jgi:hypothetical protein
LVTYRNTTYRVLLHVGFPYVVFAAPEDVGLPVFLDCDQLAGALAEYNIIPAATLNAPPNEEALALLSDAEHKDIRYWRPSRLGDVIFNWWD